MAHYSPKFKEPAIRNGGWPDVKMKVGDVVLSFRAIYRLKSDAQEAKKFYMSIHSQVRVVRKSSGYWVYAGRK